MLTTAELAATWLPGDTGDVVIQPAIELSVAMMVATPHSSPRGTHDFRIPVVKADPSAEWVGEGETIPESDADVDEVVSPFRKVAALSRLSSESVSDSDPELDDVTGAGIGRDVARKIDAAFFGSNVTSAPGETPVVRNAKRPEGLEDVVGVTDHPVTGAWKNTDVFGTAVLRAQALGAPLDAWVTNEATADALLAMKEATSSQRKLLTADATLAGRRSIEGLPLLVSPYVTDNVVWGLPRRVVYLDVREDVEIDISEHAAFEDDTLLVRGKARVAFAFPHPAALQRIERTS